MFEFIKEAMKLIGHVFKEKDKYDKTYLLKEVNGALEALSRDDIDKFNKHLARLLNTPVRPINPKTGNTKA